MREFCKDLADTKEGRLGLQAFLGYLDAKYIVRDLYSTFGFPLEESAAQAKSRGLKLDYIGLEHELLRIGLSKSACSTQIERMRESYGH